MPTLSAALAPEGAMLDVVIGLSVSSIQTLRTALRPVPPSIPARAVIDTGAEISCLDSALVQALNLPFAGTVLTNLPALTIVHPSGNARSNLTVGNLSALELPLSYLGYQVLIGRDVLAGCRLFYNGPGYQFHLGY